MRRNPILSLVTALAAAILLTACSGGSSSKDSDSSSDTGGTPPAGTSIQIQAYTGTPRALDGTWIRCLPQASTDEKGTMTFTGDAFTVTFDDYPLSSGCTGTMTHLLTATGTVSTSTTKTGVTWTDGNTIVTAPTRAGGGGNLPDPVTPSLVSMVVATSDNPGAFPTGTYTNLKLWYVDDSGAAWRMYEEKTGLPACNDSTAAGTCLDNVGFVKQ